MPTIPVDALVYASGTPAGDWITTAACAGHDPEMFFPLSAVDAANATAVCERCPVIVDCGQWADRLNLIGVWGGRVRGDDRFKRAELVPDSVHLERLAAIADAGRVDLAAQALGVSRSTMLRTSMWAQARGYWIPARGVRRTGQLTPAGADALAVHRRAA